MGVLLPHAIFISFLVIAIASCFTVTVTDAELLHIPHSIAPSQAPSPAPSHHHHHHHHRHHSVSPSPAPTPTYLPSKPPTAYPPVKPPTKSHAPAPPTEAHAHAPYSKPPTKAHAHAPAPAPYSKPPIKAPAPSPYSKPPRKLVAVQGVIYCKNCSYAGVDTLLGASPLSGATVELRCRNTKYMIKKTSTTDKNGYFFLQAPKYITTYGAHKCRVFLIKLLKNGGSCSHATNLNGGISGAFLFFNKKLAPPPKSQPFSIFNVGPFAYEPSKCYKH